MSESTQLALVEQAPKVDLMIYYDVFNMADVEEHELVWRDGGCLGDYLEGLPEDVNWMVLHNGYEVDLEEHAKLAVQPDDRLSLVVIPTGGDAIKSVLRVVVMAAAVVAAAFGAPTWAIAAIAIAGGLVNTFLLTPKPKLNNEKEDKTYGIDGAKNTAQENIAIPIVYGEYQFAGNFCDFYTENSGDTQILYMRTVLSDGRIHSVSNIELNEQPIENFEEAEYHVTLGNEDEDVNPWFKNAVRQINKSIRLDTNWAYHVSTDDVDQARFDLLFPQGLVDIDDKKGDYDNRSVTFEIQYKLVSDADWAALDLPVAEQVVYPPNTTQTTIPAWGARRYGTRFGIPYGGASPVEVQVSPPGQNNWTTIGSYTPTGGAQVSSPTGGTEYEQVEIDLDDSGLVGEHDIRVTNGGTILENTTYHSGGTFTITDNRTAQIRRSIFSPALQRGVYEFRIRRTSAPSNDKYLIDDVYLQDVAEIEHDPVALVGTATLSIKIKLTDQLNGAPNVTCKVKGAVVDIYDAQGNVTAQAWSNNRADIILDTLLGEQRGIGYDATKIDFQKFDEWRQYCAAENLAFNGVLDDTTNLHDACKDIYTGGYAAPISIGTKLSLAIDKPREPVGAFTSATMIEGSFGVTYLPLAERANEYEVTYYDRNDGNKQKTIRYVDPDAVQNNDTPRVSSIDMRGVDSSEQATKILWRALYSNRLLIRVAHFDTYMDSLNAVIGDVILLQSNRMEWSKGGLLQSGSTTTAIKLDQPVDYDVGNDYVAMVQYDALLLDQKTVTARVGSSITINKMAAGIKPTRAVINGRDYLIDSITTGATTDTLVLSQADVSTINVNDTVNLWAVDVVLERDVSSVTQNADGTSTVNLASALPQAPVQFQRFIYGEATKVMKPYSIVAISGDGIERRSLECIEYHEGVYAEPGHDIDIPVTPLDSRRVSHVSGVLASYTGVARLNVNEINVQVSWQAGHIKEYGGADIYASINGANFAPIANAQNVTDLILRFTQGDDVQLKIIAYNTRGDRAPYATAPIYHIAVNPTERAEEGLPVYYTDDGTPVDNWKPAEPGATNGAPNGSPVGGRLAEDIVSDIDTNAVTIAEEMLRGGSWRAERDEVLYGPDGNANIRTIVDQIGIKNNEHEVFITEQKEVTAEGYARASLAVKSDGVVAGYLTTTNGTYGTFYIVADEFGFVDPNSGGGAPTKPFYYGADNVLYLDTVRVKNLAVDSVDTDSIQQFALGKQYSATLASNVSLPASDGGRTRYLSVTVIKDRDDSDIRFEALMHPRPGRDYAGEFYFGKTTGGVESVLDTKWHWVKAATVNGLTSTRIPHAFFRYFSGIPAGTHTFWVDLVAFGGGVDEGFMEAGSSIEIIEVKKQGL